MSEISKLLKNIKENEIEYVDVKPYSHNIISTEI